MKGINRITPEIAEGLINALSMDDKQSTEFSKYISLSAFDHTLIESRSVLDDFLFGTQQKQKLQYDADIVFYDKDKYLRTLKGVLENIFSSEGKEALEGGLKIVNCLGDNIFGLIADHIEKALSAGMNLSVEHFIGLSDNDYLQNTDTFTKIFPLILRENYKLYLREKDTDDGLMQDSMLVSLSYLKDGERINQYLSLTFCETSMPECVAFDDVYMYSYLSKNYENLKNSYKDIIHRLDHIDFTDDVFMEMRKSDGSCVLKQNPSYDRIPYDVYASLAKRMSVDELKELLITMLGQNLNGTALPDITDRVEQYLKKRIENACANKQIDVLSREGLAVFAETGKLADHMEHLPALDQSERRMVLESMYKRSNDPRDKYTLYIIESEVARKGLILAAAVGFGLLIGHPSAQCEGCHWKTISIQSGRLAAIFCDYLENHIPVNQAMVKEDANSFLQGLIGNL